jgi:mannitol/fructose-specific phosphotransferase system IIA component (Ntr-type)
MKTPDGKPVRVAVVVAHESGGRAQLEILARIARLATRDIASELCAAAGPARALQIIARYEQ